MWQAWDLALDHIMAQLPALIDKKVSYEVSSLCKLIPHLPVILYCLCWTALPVFCAAALSLSGVAHQWVTV